MKTLLLLIIALPSIAFSNINLEMSGGKTEFTAIGNPGFLKINGKGEGPKGTVSIANDIMNVNTYVDLKTLDTGMSLRNKHMKEKYLLVEEFPKAKLEIKNYKLKNTSKTATTFKNEKIPAMLTIKGVSKPVTVSATLSKKNKLDSSFEIKITDFKIEIPSFMGVTVADKVTVNVSSQLKQEKIK